MIANSDPIFKASFSFERFFLKSKSYQPFSEVIFIPISFSPDHSIQCFEFQWIIRKGRMGSAIWKLFWKPIVLHKYASFFFSLLILTQNSDTETDARLNSEENNANMNFATSNLSIQLGHKGKHKLECMNILKWVKWSVKESKEKFR